MPHPGGQLLEQADPAFAHHPSRRLLHRHQHRAHAAVVVPDRAAAVAPVHVVHPFAAGDRHQVILVPGRLALGHDALDLGADDGPDLGPALAASRAPRGGMAIRSHAGPVAVIVELDQVGAPPEEHGVPRREQGADRRAQASGPGLDRAHGGRGPIEGPGERGHLAGAAEEDVDRARKADAALLDGGHIRGLSESSALTRVTS